MAEPLRSRGTSQPVLSRSTTLRLRLLVVMAIASAIAGGLYAVVDAPRQFSWLEEIGTGALVGAVIGASIVAFELFGADRLLTRRGRHLPLSAAILVRTTLYGVVILAALLIVPWLVSGVTPDPLRPGIVGDVLFSIAATFAFVTLLSMVQLIGLSELGRLLTGRYYSPREVERIVLFLDLIDSTSIAERLGPVRFHSLLSETFTRLARVVTDNGGEVYRYVGDALIATWPLDTRKKNARPISCLFACQDTLETVRASFVARYGEAPTFHASLHAGLLVAGEIGGFKREIALLGDTMNTAARLEQECRVAGHLFLVSKPLIERTELPPGIAAVSIGSRQLRGKAERMELFALERGGAEGRSAATTAPDRA